MPRRAHINCPPTAPPTKCETDPIPSHPLTPPHSEPRRRQEGFTWHVVRAIGSGMQLVIEGLQELPSLLREPRPRPAAAFVVLWIIGV